LNSIMKCTVVLFLTVVSITLAASQFVCPQKDGLYPDKLQCDKYYECVGGVATENLCEDGLAFNTYRRSARKCESLLNVDCSGRELLQPPKPVGDCPRMNGVYEHPDKSICHMMLSCTSGESSYMTCPADLIFDKFSSTCTWPANTDREGCIRREEVLEDGFRCPAKKQRTIESTSLTHPRYPHPIDCQQFYVCLDGVIPRLQSCSGDDLFNPDTLLCQPKDEFDSKCYLAEDSDEIDDSEETDESEN